MSCLRSAPLRELARVSRHLLAFSCSFGLLNPQLNFTDISTGKLVSRTILSLSPGFSVATLFSGQNSSEIYAIATSGNNTDRFLELFIVSKLREASPQVIKFPSLSLPDGVEQSFAISAALTNDFVIVSLGGTVLMWSGSDLTSLPKKVFSITTPSDLGMDAVAGATTSTDPSVVNTKLVLIWDFWISSSVYIIDITSTTPVPVQIDLRKLCGGDSHYAGAARRSFFDQARQRFFLVVDNCKSSAAPMLVSLDTTAFPPTVENMTPKLDGPLSREAGNFIWAFQMN